MKPISHPPPIDIKCGGFRSSDGTMRIDFMLDCQMPGSGLKVFDNMV
jgi:hypothetical protein